MTENEQVFETPEMEESSEAIPMPSCRDPENVDETGLEPQRAFQVFMGTTYATTTKSPFVHQTNYELNPQQESPLQRFTSIQPVEDHATVNNTKIP